MKKLLISFTSLFLLLNVNGQLNAGILDKLEGGLDRLFGQEVETKSDVEAKKAKKKKLLKSTNPINQTASQPCEPIKKGSLDKLEAGLDRLFGQEVKTKADALLNAKCHKKKNQAKIENEEIIKNNNSNNNLSLYTGTFDIIDKEGDDQTTLFGIEHKNPNLFRDTFLGKFKPVTGAFMTGKSSVYLYTGIEGQYGIGPLKILPSFAPGYYEKGDGKDLGDVLEFKSEIKFGLDIFENSKLSYSYSHISNNDWGATNPGTDNQQITFSKNF